MEAGPFLVQLHDEIQGTGSIPVVPPNSIEACGEAQGPARSHVLVLSEILAEAALTDIGLQHVESPAAAHPETSALDCPSAGTVPVEEQRGSSPIIQAELDTPAGSTDEGRAAMSPVLPLLVLPGRDPGVLVEGRVPFWLASQKSQPNARTSLKI